MASITPTKNGPYIVKGLDKLTNPAKEFPTQEEQALCRCGHSKNKPFCDGSHVAAKFSGVKIRKETYDTIEFKGKEVTVVDNIGICAHAGECTKGVPNVFFSWEGENRISNPDKGDKEKIIATIRKCPSGSLAYKLDGKLHDKYFSEEEIFISKNGPLHIRGGVKLDDKSSKELISKEHYTLCRCGASKN
ncbi:TPA: hypothetical protein HA278_03565, partial [Candidatus Woesearchaeota archaeon]|nr:hypothetical protein [Candidatus Woesearchaeota archaeon]